VGSGSCIASVRCRAASSPAAATGDDGAAVMAARSSVGDGRAAGAGDSAARTHGSSQSGTPPRSASPDRIRWATTSALLPVTTGRPRAA
jgi:hypothetical protein